MLSRWMMALACASLLLACEGAPSQGAGGPASSTVGPGARSSVSPATSGSASPTGSASAATPPVATSAPKAFAGTYQAKKGKVSLDPGVSEPMFSLDKEKTFAGPGTVKLEIAPDGRITGTLGGALGELIVSGQLEDGVMAIAFDAAAPSRTSMSGFATLKPNGERHEGPLHASSGDALIVRVGEMSVTPASPDAAPR